MVAAIFLSIFKAWASDMEGSNTMEKEPVMAQGNIISGRAIPVKTP